MKISVENRDALARIASSAGGMTLDDALGDVLAVYESLRSVERLSAGELADWRRESREWAEIGLEVTD